MIEYIKNGLKTAIQGKSVLILGFGREGKSSYKSLRRFFPELVLTIADSNIQIGNDEILKDDPFVNFVLGENYLSAINTYDFVLKSPGISLKSITYDSTKISSQTDLFFSLFKQQIIGVTGTKGKSTTVSLLFHLISRQHPDTLLVGNIGIPAFDIFDKISENSLIVFELSSHQLEFVHHSPTFSILLNLFEEHLDHYNSFWDYQKSKFNIALFQKESDFFISNAKDELIQNLLKNHFIHSKKLFFDQSSADASFDSNGFYCNSKFLAADFKKIQLHGKHNYLNVCAALLIIESIGLDTTKAISDLYDFKPLEHRMEFVLKHKEISFYNDSIATIPEACIQAIESVPNVQTLILGGFDRGIHYELLVNYLLEKPVKTIILLGKVGEILKSQLQEKNFAGKLYKAENLEKAVEIAFEFTSANESCLLSPAASSYDAFKNFEERGRIFKELVHKKAALLH